MTEMEAALTERRSAATAPHVELGPGSRVGEWQIEEMIAMGGMGIVYAARHSIIGKRAALKLLRPEFAAQRDIIRRFVAEATAVNRINHPNIIDVFGFGQHVDGRHYYVMEYLEGESLAERLERVGRLTMARALPILRHIAAALDAAHELGVVHRDLKPDNVFLVEGGAAKVLDFGIAKLVELRGAARTQPGAIMGTPLCMSPEQCRGADIDHRSDVYAFGAMVYRTLVGRFPFEADEVHALMYQHIEVAAPPPSGFGAASELDGPLLRALAKQPEDRYDTLTAVLDALEGLDDEPMPAPISGPGASPLATSRPRTNPPVHKTKCLAFSPDGAMLVADGADGDVVLRDTDGHLVTCLEGHQGQVTHVAFSSDGALIASAALDRTIRVWNTDGSLVHVLRGHQDDIAALRFSRDGERILSGGHDTTVRVWEIGTGREHVYRGHRSAVRCVCDSPQDDRIASGSDDWTVRVWGDERGARWVFRSHTMAVREVVFSPDGCRLAAAGYDGVLMEWNVMEPYNLAKSTARERRGHRGGISDLVYSPDSERIASAGSDGTVRLWPRDHRLAVVLGGHTRRVTRLAFSNNSRFLASASVDSTVRLWDTKRARCTDVIALDRPSAWIAFSPDGEQLLSSCSSDVVVRTTVPVVVTREPRRRKLTARPKPPRANTVAARALLLTALVCAAIAIAWLQA